MKKHHLWMALGCVALAAVALALPALGWQVAGVPLIFAVLMVACCVGPMLLALVGRGGDKSARPDQADDKKRSGPSCH